MITLAEQASNAFNRVMEAHSINLQSNPIDFTPGSQCIFIGITDSSKTLVEGIFNELFKPAPNGIYYLYMTYESFLLTMGVENLARSQPAKLRFFSTNKNSSIGEYCPMCIELGLNKDWRADGSGLAGHQTEWMDELYYRSFAHSPDHQAERFWDEFTGKDKDKGKGVRLAIEVTTSPRHADFRFVTYEGSPAVAALVEVREAMQHLGYNLRVQGFPRMPAYGQKAEFNWQQEVRLIAKRYGPKDSVFPWPVFKCSHFSCNYFDCSLTHQDSEWFSVRLVGVTPGPKTNESQRTQIADLFEQYQQDCASAMPSATSSIPSTP